MDDHTTPDHDPLARLSRAAERAERAAEHMEAIAARLDAREQSLNAAYARATRNLVALANLIGDPIPEELAADAGRANGSSDEART